MYSPSFAKADDDDKENTARNIMSLYSWYTVDNESPINDVDEGRDLDEYMNDEFNLWEEDPRAEEKQAYEDQIAALQDQIYDYENKEYEMLNQKIDDTFAKDEEKKWLTDEQKAANEEASSAAWNAAQWWTNAEATPTQTSANEQQVVNSENYWDRSTKIMNILWNLWYKFNTTAPSDWWEQGEAVNIEWWEPQQTAEEQVAEANNQIEQSNETDWQQIPEYNDEQELLNSYNDEFDKLLSEYNAAKWKWYAEARQAYKALKTYLQAKDAAALYTVRNWLSNDYYTNMVNKLKWNRSLQTLLRENKSTLLSKYKRWQTA